MEAVQALAAFLGVSVGALTGLEPLPPPGSETPVSAYSILIPEKGWLLPADGKLHPVTDIEVVHIRDWTMPADMLAERGLNPEHLMVVRAPESANGVSRGDRMLVDAMDVLASPPGLFFAWDGLGMLLLRCSTVHKDDRFLIRVERPGGEPRDYVPGDEIELVGRVVGRWAWL